MHVIGWIDDCIRYKVEWKWLYTDVYAYLVSVVYTYNGCRGYLLKDVSNDITCVTLRRKVARVVRPLEPILSLANGLCHWGQSHFIPFFIFFFVFCCRLSLGLFYLSWSALISPPPLPWSRLCRRCRGSRLLRDEALACEVVANHLMTASVLILTLQLLAGRKTKSPQPNQHEANSQISSSSSMQRIYLSSSDSFQRCIERDAGWVHVLFAWDFSSKNNTNIFV